MVHACNIAIFFFLGIYPLSILNVFSTIFYSMILFIFKKNTDFYIIFSYFEILTFSFLSEIFAGCAFFYIFYVIGMISVVFYLLPPKERLKHIVQGIGVLYAVRMVKIV
ncbi:hypothetical protein [Treponema sp.]|uniref:hypothetical protein n=1 Tax=Treponema sp. TaxID=166 RepID=UPI00388D4BBC